jgi:hypothetical protein
MKWSITIKNESQIPHKLVTIVSRHTNSGVVITTPRRKYQRVVLRSEEELIIELCFKSPHGLPGKLNKIKSLFH